jgi:cytosine/adenosine deaminase-related metal-dependent hydrolase
MPLDQAIARATINAREVFRPSRVWGTLRVGAPADVAVFRLEEGIPLVIRHCHARRHEAAVPACRNSRWGSRRDSLTESASAVAGIGRIWSRLAASPKSWQNRFR